MSTAYVIETTSNIAAGVAIREEKSFRFFAAEHRFATLERERYRSLRALHAALEAIDPASGARTPSGLNGPSRPLWKVPA